MRPLTFLILALFSSTALAGNVHKCRSHNGAVYYSDKACSTRNHREPTFDEAAVSGQQHPAAASAKKKKKSSGK